MIFKSDILRGIREIMSVFITFQYVNDIDDAEHFVSFNTPLLVDDTCEDIDDRLLVTTFNLYNFFDDELHKSAGCYYITEDQDPGIMETLITDFQSTIFTIDGVDVMESDSDGIHWTVQPSARMAIHTAEHQLETEAVHVVLDEELASS